MGKNTTKSESTKHDKNTASSSSPVNKVKKVSKVQPSVEKLCAVIQSVGLPNSADGLTADKLNENQKHVLKKVCAKMYGHQHTEKRVLPARSLESATAQLEKKMKEQLAQRKKAKKLAKQKSANEKC